VKHWYAIPAAIFLGVGAAAGQTASPAGAAPSPTSITNPVGMEFVLIQPGTFTVGRLQVVCPVRGPNGTPTFTRPAAAGGGGGVGSGAAPGGPGGAPANRPPPDPRTFWTPQDSIRCAEMAQRDSRPGFPVTIERPFYLGTHEVTQQQWRRVMGTNPSVFQGDLVEGDSGQHPVDNVTWEEAQAFIRRLNELDPSARYRLPTEFEWEYAAYAGSTEEPTWASARAQAATGNRSTFPVGSKEPNAYGLYDMFGNVWEWVEDWYNEKLFPDPSPPATGSYRVLKGGSFVGDVKNFTPATHAAGPANGWDVGFRILREVP
jgi:formylglycine-generating enzyme